MSRPEKAIAQIATVATATLRANSNTGRGYARYPASKAEDYPHLNLFWDETPIEYGIGAQQFWMITVRGQLLVSLKGDTITSDISRADPLIVPLVDAFAPDSANYHLESDDPNTWVDFCQLGRVSPSKIIEWSGAVHYGCELTFTLKLRRQQGDA